jgi:hypothetical protein
MAAAVLSAQPTLTFDGSEIRWAGGSSGGEVAWFSVERVPLGYHQRVVIQREVTVADAEGLARWVQPEEPSRGSVWVAVDLDSGELALAAPPGGVLRTQLLPVDAFEADGSQELTAVRYAGHVVAEALLVRTARSETGAEVWGLRANDGGVSDADGKHDGVVTLSAASLQPVEEDGETAGAFQPGDVLVLIDPDRLQVSTVQLEERSGGQGGER